MSQYGVAQKYGAFVEQNGNNNNHCAAIIYTPTPIIVVVMTRNVGDYQRRIGEVGAHLAEVALQLDEKKAALEREAEARAEAEAQAAAVAVPADPGAEALQPESGEAGNAAAAPAGTPQVVPEKSAGSHSMLRMAVAVGVTGLLMLAVGLAAEAGGRGGRRSRKK